MFKLLSSKLLGFLPLKGWIVGLVLALSASTAIAGKLLLNAKVELGQQNVLIAQEKANSEQWQIANDLSIKAYQDLDKKILQRSKEYLVLSQINNELQNKLKVVPDETGCLDMPLPDDVGLLLNADDKAGDIGMPETSKDIS